MARTFVGASFLIVLGVALLQCKCIAPSKRPIATVVPKITTTVDEQRPEDISRESSKAFLSEEQCADRMIIHKEPLECPSTTDQKYLEADVRAKIRITQDGTVDAVLIVQSNSFIFNGCVVEALKKWRFEPPVLPKKSKYCYKYVAVSFRK
jgi:outer membrane biosynthesis protein TonB